MGKTWKLIFENITKLLTISTDFGRTHATGGLQKAQNIEYVDFYFNPLSRILFSKHTCTESV